MESKRRPPTFSDVEALKDELLSQKHDLETKIKLAQIQLNSAQEEARALKEEKNSYKETALEFERELIRLKENLNAQIEILLQENDDLKEQEELLALQKEISSLKKENKILKTFSRDNNKNSQVENFKIKEVMERSERLSRQERVKLEEEAAKWQGRSEWLEEQLAQSKQRERNYKTRSFEIQNELESVQQSLQQKIDYISGENQSLRKQENLSELTQIIRSLEKENEQLLKEASFHNKRQSSLESDLEESDKLTARLRKEIERLAANDSAQVVKALKEKVKKQETALEKSQAQASGAQQAAQKLRFLNESAEEELLNYKNRSKTLQARLEETEEKLFTMKGRTAPLESELKHLQALYEREKTQSAQKDQEIAKLIRQTNNAELALEKAKLTQENDVSNSVEDKRKDDLILALKETLKEERQKAKAPENINQGVPSLEETSPNESENQNELTLDGVFEDDEDEQVTAEFQLSELTAQEQTEELQQAEEIQQDENSLPLQGGVMQMAIPKKENDIGDMFEVSNEPIWKLKNDITGNIEADLSFLDIKQRIAHREIHSETLLKKPGVTWKRVKDIFEFNTDIVSKTINGQLRLFVKRESIRMPASENVRIHTFNINAVCSNISYGGCFLESPRLLEDFANIGDEIEFEFADKGEHKGLKIKAIIRNFISGDPSGIGLQFTDMSVESKVRLNQFFKKFVKNLNDAA